MKEGSGVEDGGGHGIDCGVGQEIAESGRQGLRKGSTGKRGGEVTAKWKVEGGDVRKYAVVVVEEHERMGDPGEHAKYQ